jgi:hypothetical protein
MRITTPQSFVFSREELRLRLVAYLVFLALAVHVSIAQTASANHEGAPMKEFAFIFRQTPFPMTAEQQKQRAEDVRLWAVRLREEGHKLNPYLVGTESYFVPPAQSSSSNTRGAGEDPVIALLLIDFPSFEEANKAAQSHPGLHYGVSIEIREATAPPPVPAAAQPSR